MSEEQLTDQAVEPEGQKMISQEDVNGLIAKNRKQAEESLLKKLGVEDFNSAKEGLTKLKELQDEQKSESERLKEQYESTEKMNSELKALNASLEAQNIVLKKGVRSEAVEDVMALAQRLVNDEVSIDQAVDEVLSKYPQFGSVQEEPRPKFTVNGNPTVTEDKVKDPFQAVVDEYKK